MLKQQAQEMLSFIDHNTQQYTQQKIAQLNTSVPL